MMTKCDFKMENGASLIIAPENRVILPGRMIRMMVANLERRFQLMEYSSVIGYKAADEMEDVLGIIELRSGFFKRLMGKQELCVFQKLHPSLYDEEYVQLSEEEQEAFRENLEEGDDFIKADYSLSVPPYFFMAVSQDDSKKLIEVFNHLKLKDFAQVRDAVANLCDASISIFDEVELLAEYTSGDIPEIMTEGLDEWLMPPEHVDRLDI
jgi:hypothetical protein